jgi:U32 family peptidase
MTERARPFPMPELLAPAGGPEQLEAALRFGADAVYGGLARFGLRAAAQNFTPETLREAVARTHGRGKRFYVTLNILPFDRDMDGFLETAGYAAAAGADAAIVSDLGAALALRKAFPALLLHVSTQANVLNTRAALHWHEAVGAVRVVLSREMCLADIRAMRDGLPAGMELEAFVHGAVCVAYSGRCLLSAALTGRSANRGECAQPCRWRYAVAEEKRPGRWMPVEEDERGTTLFSAYDLRMIEHLPELIGAGVSSLKIEGRMKTAYYVATVVSAYRRALDVLASEGEAVYRARLPMLTAELAKASHRASDTGFYFGAPTPPAGAEGLSQTMEYVGAVSRGACAGEPAEVTLKNRFFAGDALEALTPNGSMPFLVQGITLADTGEIVDTCGVAGTRILLTLPFAVEAGDILRGPNRNHT